MIIYDRRCKDAEGFGRIESILVMDAYVGVHLDLGYYIKIRYDELQQIMESIWGEVEVEK